MAALELLAERAREAARSGSEVPSPCISVCRIDPASGLCEGCLRTLDEIAAWGRMEDQGKREVWHLIEQRAITSPLSQRDEERNERDRGT